MDKSNTKDAAKFLFGVIYASLIFYCWMNDLNLNDESYGKVFRDVVEMLSFIAIAVTTLHLLGWLANLIMQNWED